MQVLHCVCYEPWPIAPAIAHAPTAEDAAMDDLDKYLALPVEDNLNLDVLS